MPKNLELPIRMCVSCRKRDNQRVFLRLQCIAGSLRPFTGNGRSFYLCYDCLDDHKKSIKSLMRQCKSGDKNSLTNRLKEIIADDRES